MREYLRAAELCLLVVKAALVLLFGTGCASRPSEPRQPPRPQTVDVAADSESDYWDAIAEQVERGRIANTDVILLIVDELKKDGVLKDVSRVDVWRPMVVQINEGNRGQVARKLRGE